MLTVVICVQSYLCTVTLDYKASLSVQRQKLWPLPCLPLPIIWLFFSFSLLWLFLLLSRMYSSVTSITVCAGGMVRWNRLSAEVHPLNTALQYLWTPNGGLLTLDYTVCRLWWCTGNRWWRGIGKIHKMAATLFRGIPTNSVINNLRHSIWTGMSVEYRLPGGRIRIPI